MSTSIRVRGRVTASVREPLQPLRDVDDLHEIDLDAELWHRLPELPAPART